MLQKNRWFGPKRFGFGIGPTSRQGWLLLIFFVVAGRCLHALHVATWRALLGACVATLIVAAGLWAFQSRR